MQTADRKKGKMGEGIKIPRVPIKLDKERHLCMDLRAAVLFEYHTGKAIFYPPAVEKLSAWEMTILLWALLSGEDRSLTFPDVGGIVERSRIKGSELGKKCFEAWAKCEKELEVQMKQEVNHGH